MPQENTYGQAYIAALKRQRDQAMEDAAHATAAQADVTQRLIAAQAEIARLNALVPAAEAADRV